MSNYVVAIDGGVGTGKTTVANEVARRIGAKFLSTGRIYRAIGLNTMLEKIEVQDTKSLKEMINNTKIDVVFDGDNQLTYLNGNNVSNMLNNPKMDHLASEVAKIQFIRDYVIAIQRAEMKKHNLVLEGRDIGTVVAPDAKFKFFFTASNEVKAERRLNEWLKQGKIILDKQQLLKDIKERDEKDAHRELSPLYTAPDAVVVDTSNSTIDEVAEYICKIIKGAK